jgi:putative intracellular protease/amidase
MLKIHHLNLGTMRAIPVDSNSITSCHCLLLEEPSGLVLIDTGLGLIEMQQPLERFGQQLMDIWGFTINEALPAVAQLRRMGFDPADVKHIVITHLDVDHAGGLQDFPQATVHLATEELANLDAKNPRYLFNQFDHGPRWHAHGPSSNRWMGLEARDLNLGLSSAVKLIPLFGHTHGHCGVAIQQGNKWLLHAGDTYYRRAEFISDDNAVSALASHTADDNAQRIASIAALRQLAQSHAEEVEFFSTHDYLELPDPALKRLLVVTTSNDHFERAGVDHPTGVWLSEFAEPYIELHQTGIAMTVASPRGGAIPIDPRSEPNATQQVEWAAALSASKNTRRLAEMRSEDFDAVFIPGGHGPMFDLPHDAYLIRLLGEFDAAGKVIAAVCHGPAGLLNAKRLDGCWLVSGKKVTAYTTAEEIAAKLDKDVPFLLEAELTKRGAVFVNGGLKADHVQRDGNLITGQNPYSSQSLAKALREALIGAQ